MDTGSGNLPHGPCRFFAQLSAEMGLDLDAIHGAVVRAERAGFIHLPSTVADRNRRRNRLPVGNRADDESTDLLQPPNDDVLSTIHRCWDFARGPDMVAPPMRKNSQKKILDNLNSDADNSWCAVTPDY